MKKIIYSTIILLIFISCRESEINFKSSNTNVLIEVPDIIINEASENDPEQTGISCSGELQYLKRTNSGYVIEPIEIPTDLPDDFDLSNDMPPVRSQGDQGSCVAWATSYYLKSYQEKIQHNYEYETYENVMSPSFIYNQIKCNDDCSGGSMIVDALYLLSTVGTTSWKEFPYSDLTCSNTPTDEQVQIANQNKIKEYFRVEVLDENSNENYTLINLIKTLITQKNPIIVAMDFKNLVFVNEVGNYIASSYSLNPIESCGHAIVIVGYDNEIHAFKIVNSWGTNWGNNGYAWISYNFFENENNINYQKGLNGAYVAFDDED